MSDTERAPVAFGFGELLRAARRQKKMSQDDLANSLGVGLATISLAETKVGKVAPKLLLSAYAELCKGEGPERLSTWLVAWLGDTLNNAANPDLQPLAATAVELLARGREERPYKYAPLTTLADLEPFRRDPNLRVIFADRKEPAFRPTPYARGDLPVAYSGAASDLMFIESLGLHRSVVMLSDKIVHATSPEYCQEQFGHRNLIVVGSPATNLFARLVNGVAPFRFNLDPKLVMWERRFREEKLLNVPRFQVMFWNVAQYMLDIAQSGVGKVSRAKRTSRVQEFLKLDMSLKDVLARNDDALRAFDTHNAQDKPLSDEDLTALHEIINEMATLLPDKGTHKDLLNMFRGDGILDMADGAINGRTTYDYNDFGLLALCPNPFTPDDPEHACVYAAGLHGPGTSHSLRLLAGVAEENCAERPFGGTFEVTMQTVRPWPEKFQSATVTWQTAPYGRSKLLGNLEREIHARDNSTESRTSAFERLFDEQLHDCARFVRSRAGG